MGPFTLLVSMQCWRWTAVWGVCQIIVAYKKEKGLLTPQSTDAAQEVDRGLMCIVRGTNSEMFSPCCETWIQLKESENFWAKWCIITKTQNLKMKELVSAAAVSFRHARAQVFSFWPFFFCRFLREYVWWWTRTPILYKLPLRPRRCTLISDVIRWFLM